MECAGEHLWDRGRTRSGVASPFPSPDVAGVSVTNSKIPGAIALALLPTACAGKKEEALTDKAAPAVEKAAEAAGAAAEELKK